MPIKYAVPAGSARITLFTALAARYTGGTARGWDVLDGLDTHPAFQISGRFGYAFGKTRVNSNNALMKKRVPYEKQPILQRALIRVHTTAGRCDNSSAPV